MSKKLYRVKVILYVMAENESEARVAATNAKFDIFECMARKAESIDLGWNNAIPYNADDDRTCAEIFINPSEQIQAESPSPTITRQPRPRKWIIANVPYIDR